MQKELLTNLARSYLMLAKVLKARNVLTWKVYAKEGMETINKVIREDNRTNVLPFKRAA